MAETYHFYLAAGSETEESKDRTHTYTDINIAIRAFRKAVTDGHEYACLELLRDRESDQ